MTIRGYRNNIGWNIAKRVRAYRSSVSNWVNAKTISVYRSAGVSPYWDMVYPDPPQSSGSVSVLGSGEVNTNFTLSDNTPWVNEPYIEVDSTTYQWQKSSSQSGPWANVTGATSSSYTIINDDLGSYFRCILTGTNEKGSVQLTSLTSNQVSDPTYIFNFGQSFAVYPNSFIRLDESGSGFPATDSIIAVERTLAYFFGEFKQFDLSYKSDLNTLRIYHRIYREDRASRPTNPDAEYEIVFTSGSNTAEIYVINPIDTSYITSYAAYLKGLSVYKQYTSLFYFSGIKSSVPMNSSSAISSTIAHASNTIQISSVTISGGVATFTTVGAHNILGSNFIYGLTGDLSVFNGRQNPGVPNSNTFTLSTSLSNRTVFPSDARSAYIPSFLTGWIYINSNLDSDSTPVPFYPGSGLPSPLFGSNVAYNKQNMYWPTTITLNNATYSSTTSASISWSGSNAGSYSITVRRSDNSTVVFGPTVTTNNSITADNLSLGVTYTFEVTPNSRNDGLGQFGFTSTKSYPHAGPPSAPTNVLGTPGNGQVSLTWTAPSSNGGSAIIEYKVRYSSNGGVSWSSPISTGSTANAYTVTGLTNGTSYVFQVLARNSSGDGPWSNSSSSIIPDNIPTDLFIGVSPASIKTLGETAVFTVYLRNSSGNVAKSGVPITFSLSSTAGGSINITSTTTDSNGMATTTYTSGNSSGTATVTVTSSSISGVSRSASVSVTLRDPLNPSLSWSPQNYGVSVSHSNYSPLWSYSGSITFPGSLSNGSYASTAFTVFIPVQEGANQPQMTGDNTNGTNYAGTITCTISNTWVINPTVSITVSNSRTGYNSGSSTLFNVQGNRSRTGLLYEVQNTANGNIIHSSGIITATTYTWRYPGADVGKNVRWRVTSYYSDNSTVPARFSQSRTLG